MGVISFSMDLSKDSFLNGYTRTDYIYNLVSSTIYSLVSAVFLFILNKKIDLLSNPLMSDFIFLSKESTAAKTAIIENIPIVTPSNESNVLNLLFRKAFIAKPKLSFNNRK